MYNSTDDQENGFTTVRSRLQFLLVIIFYNRFEVIWFFSNVDICKKYGWGMGFNPYGH